MIHFMATVWQVQSFATDYGTLIDGIRERVGPSGRIIALNLPNLARLPYRASAPRQEREAAQRASVGITTAINAMTSRGVRVLDLMCNAALYAPTSLYSDGFHPNDAGYALIATDVVRAVTASSFPAPQSNCPLMTGTVPSGMGWERIQPLSSTTNRKAR